MSTVEHGRQLEQQIASFFSANGYLTRLNAVLTGRSGGRHEVDVLGEKSDALTTYRVAIECKAWQQPIEKDVVSKLHYILGDLGLNKGIIVSLSGTRSGADRTAADLGIELWGPDELRRYLGEPATAALSVPHASNSSLLGWGHSPRTTVEAATKAIQSSGKGRMHLRTLEKLVWTSMVWLPVYSVAITIAQTETKRFKATLRSSQLSNLYEAISGRFIGVASAPWEQIEVDRPRTLNAAVRDSKVHATIRKVHQDLERVSSAAAVERHSQSLRHLGIPTPCTSIAIGQSSLVYLPFYVGVLDAAGRQRAAAVCARTGAKADLISEILTANLEHLRLHFTDR